MTRKIRTGIFTQLDPTPEEIEERAAEIRATWTETERRRRLVTQQTRVEIHEAPRVASDRFVNTEARLD